MNKRFFALLMVFALAGAAVSAQIKQADKLFKSYSYSIAIPYYLKIAQKAGDPDRNQAIIRLADCYRLTNDQLSAKAWYAQAVKLPEAEPINWFYYGQALRCAQEYDLAKEAYDKYATLATTDPRGKAYSGFCTQVEKLNDLPALFEIKNAKNLNSNRSDFGPSFYGEGIIYVSDRRQNFMEDQRYEWTNFNYLDLYFSRPKYLDEFYQDMNEPKSFSGMFNQTYHDGPAAFAKHDSLIYFSRTEKGNEAKDADNYRTDKLKIYWAINNGTWSKAEPFFLNSNEYSVGHPSLTPDGNTLYFVSDMPGGFGGTDIYCCQWQSGSWSKPQNLGDKVNSFGNEMFPGINGDKLYFASDGIAGFGGLDIFCTTLTKGTWSKPENLGRPLNSSFDDFSLVLDSRGKKGFFSSNRPGGEGSDDIYACKKSDIKQKRKVTDDQLAGIPGEGYAFLSGSVKDKQSLKPLPGSTVFLLDTKTDKVKVLKADANGKFKVPIEKGTFYVVKAMENNYLADCLNFKIEAEDTIVNASAPHDLLLDRLELNKVFRINNMNYEIEPIYYDFDKWYIRPDAELELDKLVQVMKENPISIELGSHTDSRGSNEYNTDLSQKRAESAVRYIVLQGIEATRISAKGYGESMLTNRCSDGVRCSETEHQANRRTEFRVTGFNSPDAKIHFDMGKFNDGDEIPVYMFDRDFFINCLQERLSKEPTNAEPVKTDPSKVEQPKVNPPAKTQPSNVAPPAKTPVSNVTEPAKVQPSNIVQPSKSQTVDTKPAKEPKPETTTRTNPFIKKEKTAENAAKGELKSETSGISYKVQLYALSRLIPLNDAEFAGLEDIQRYEEDGLYKYTAGIFNTSLEAHAYRDIVVEMGFRDAFVITFENGKRVNPIQASK
jgi:outer membrane protein OmpA-like peptidoglycan-associated protein/tetratricopeptide (TPR) repeat protein